MLRSVLVALVLAPVLTFMPAPSYAGPSCQPREAQTISCAAGSVWDATAGTCVKQLDS